MPSGRTSIVCAGQQPLHAVEERVLAVVVQRGTGGSGARVERRAGGARCASWNSAFSSDANAKPSGRVDVVERLDAEPVAGEEQLAAFVVGDREREHAGEVVDDVAAPLLEPAEDDLGVGVVGDEPPAAGLELAAQLGVVVDLAVEDEREVAIVAVERLVAGRDVDDREAPHPDREVRADVGALAVGAAVHDRTQHLFEQLGIGAGEPDDAAHREQPTADPDALSRVRAAPAVLGPTWRSSQRFTGPASRHVVDDAVARAAAVCSHGCAERRGRRGCPSCVSRSARGWSASKPRGTRFSDSRASTSYFFLRSASTAVASFGPGAVVGDRGAEPLELIGREVVVAAADVEALGRDLHVVRGAAFALR